MLDNVFQRKDVKELLEDIITMDRLNEKEIPNVINDKKITNKEYSFYAVFDAIMKYVIIINDEDLFPKYLEKIRMLLKKLNEHNEIKGGIVKLIIKMCGYKLGIEDFENTNNKIKITNYIYEKYIKEGYLYHAFPSCFIDEVKEKGLDINTYYRYFDELKEINEIFAKYRIDDVITKSFEGPHLAFTDSFFMASFYANSSPMYLQEICENIDNNVKPKIDLEAFVLKKYNRSLSNIDYITRKSEMTSSEKNKIMDFFKKEWDDLKIVNNMPTIALVKRSLLGKDNLYHYEGILSMANDADLFTMVYKVLDTGFNDVKVTDSISKENIRLVNIEPISNYYHEDDKPINALGLGSAGSVTLLIVLGSFLVSLGVVLSTIMIMR